MIMNDKYFNFLQDKPCMDDEFLCSQSQYCIKLIHYCDRVEHCPNDFSDEPEKCNYLFPYCKALNPSAAS